MVPQMYKNLTVLLVSFFFVGCATPRGKLTTIVDYVAKNEQAIAPIDITAENKSSKPSDTPVNTNAVDQSAPAQANVSELDPQMAELNYKIDKLEKMLQKINDQMAENTAEIKKDRPDRSAYKFEVSKIWNFVLNEKYANEVYHGISLTGTSSNNLFSFKLMISVSRNIQESSLAESVPTPEVLLPFIEYETLVKMRTENFLTNIVITPSVTVPLVRYQLKIGFGSVPVFNTSIELRTGLAYDMYFFFRYGNYRVYLLDEGEKRVYLPSSLSDKSWFASISTISLDLEPFHFDANFIVGANEAKITLGVGIVW